MRERYLEAFDLIRIDNLHGDRIISEYAPDGRTSETVFALRGQSPGIKVGTSIALLSRSGSTSDPEAPSGRVWYRDFDQARADERRRAMLDSLDAPTIDAGYSVLGPDPRLGLPFKPMPVSADWFDWPTLPELFPGSFPGVQTGRDTFLIDTDLDRLEARITDYFNPDLSHEAIAQRYPRVMTDTGRFNARATRDALLRRGGPNESGFVRHAYRPFDNRWLYWEAETKLLDEKRADYKPHVFEGNLWLSVAQHLRKGAGEPQACLTEHIASRHLIERGTNMFPAWLRDEATGETVGGDDIRPGPGESVLESVLRRANLSGAAKDYLEHLGLGVEDLFYHVLATLHDPTYREANAGALRMEWPRIPLPGWPAGGADPKSPCPQEGDPTLDAVTLARSAARGRELARLLDPDSPVPGVTQAPLRPEFAAIAVPSTVDGRNMTDDDFALTAGWGHFGAGGAVMPGQGHLLERNYTPRERTALADTCSTLGKTTFDIYLNDRAYWCNVPAAVWRYQLGGYQVLKKWLSYRERAILDRSLTPDEVQYFTDTVRRIGALLLLLASNAS